MTPRGTDWSLALLVAVLVATGVVGLDSGAAWVFAVHDVAGLTLAVVVVWKLRRVWRRVLEPSRWDRRTGAAVAAVVLVGATLASGFVWAGVTNPSFGGFRLLAWHEALGFALGAIVLTHALLRARPLRRRDVGDRRTVLQAGGAVGFALAAWALQRPLGRLFGAPAAERRFTGSYEKGSFAGNAFPTTSWVADDPRPLDSAHRVRITGLVDEPLALDSAALEAGHELTATLDCTGGFHSEHRWSGTRLGDLLARARPRASARYVRVISHTGYRWEFALEDARDMLIATAVDGEPLSHGHGAPCRLVAPGRRGFQWVKWIDRIELHADPDHGKAASTVLSSFTREGRGEA